MRSKERSDFELFIENRLGTAKADDVVVAAKLPWDSIATQVVFSCVPAPAWSHRGAQPKEFWNGLSISFANAGIARTREGWVGGIASTGCWVRRGQGLANVHIHLPLMPLMPLRSLRCRLGYTASERRGSLLDIQYRRTAAMAVSGPDISDATPPSLIAKTPTSDAMTQIPSPREWVLSCVSCSSE